MVVLLNGQVLEDNKATISVFDRGFTLGHGLFETLLICQGKAPLLTLHWQRLTAGSKLLGIHLPLDLPELERQLGVLLLANQQMQGNYGLRLTLTDGESARGLLSDGKQTANLLMHAFALPAQMPTSMSATFVNTRRNEGSLSSQIKHMSYIDNILAKKEAVTKGFDEALMLNSRGFFADGAVTNLFMVKDRQIYTSSLADGALPGIIRALIKQHFPVSELSLLPEKLYDADALFVTNALMGVTPLHKLGNKLYPLDCPITRSIRDKIGQCYEQN